MKRFIYPLMVLFILSINNLMATGWSINAVYPNAFIENQGQYDNKNGLKNSAILFVYDQGPNQVYFTREGLTYRLDNTSKESHQKRTEYDYKEELEELEAKRKGVPSIELKSKFVHMQWVNANPAVQVICSGQTPDYFCYSSKENTSPFSHIKGFTKITYVNLYPGIDVVYELDAVSGFKYSFHVSPCADISMIQMKYAGSLPIALQSDGNIRFRYNNEYITDHAPTTFQADDRTHVIQSSFVVKGKVVSFALNHYDKTKKIIIDPWVTFPASSNSNKVWEVETDNAGNVYTYSGDMPITLRKYSPAGALQWTYLTSWDSSGYWIGGMITHPNGDSYICSGSNGEIRKINTLGAQVWYNNPNAFFTTYEYWSMAFNCDLTRLVVGGSKSTFGLPPVIRGSIMEINLANGTISNSVDVGFGSTLAIPPNVQEVSSICYSPNGNYYFLTLDSVGAIKDNLSTIVFKSPTGYHFDYYIPGYGFGTKQPISAIRATGSYLYTQNGVTVDKRDLYTGAIITSVSIPSGISNAGFFGTNVQGNGGLDIDSCGNVYVGSGNGVYKFDSNLFPIGSAPTPGPVYDVDVSSNGDVAVAGSNFTGTVSLNSCNRLASGCYSTLTASASCTNNACYGQCNATASVSAQGGTPPYSYAWSNGATTPLLTGLCSGSYTAIVSDAASLLDTVTITVNGATAPLITSVNATSASCGASNGSASVVATGGVLPFTFSWSPVGGNSPIASGLSSGTYAITVTDGLGCSVTDTVIVGSSNAPSLSLLNSSNVLCFGGMNGSAEVAASLGVSPYTYSWNTIPVQSSSIATGLSAGSYTATVTDAAGCTQQQAVVILQPATLTTTTASTPEQCGIATGTVSVTASGGTGPYTYHWLPEGGTNPTVAGLIGGTYYVSVTDSNGCTTTDSVTVASNPGVQVALINSSNVRCHGADDGSISVNALTGTPPFIYAWNTTPIQNSATAVALSPNNYTVTVTDATGCTAQLTVGITAPAPLILAGSSTPEHCGLSDGSIAISTVGGVLPLVYSWTPAVATDSLATNLPAGSYTVTVSDSNGCTVSASYSIINQTTFPVSIASASGCGASGASAIASVSGGSAPYTYSWIPGGATTASINGLADGLYACIVTDAGGCSVTQTVQVHNYPGAVAQAGSDVVIEAGTTTSLQATGGMTYLWTPPEGLSCTTCSNPVAGPLVSTQYCVTVTDTNGCTDSDCLMLTVNTECGHVFVPNAFSPDGADNVQNEMECVYGRCIDRLEFVIYSRWGEKVFEAYDKNTCWDGTYKGEKLNAAVFTYTLNATLTDGSVITQKGDISLIR